MHVASYETEIAQKNSVDQVRIINFFQFSEPHSILSIFPSGDQVPFPIKRVFTIDAHQSCLRGAHAHKECTQLMVALRGVCTVTCDDGRERKEYVLQSPAQGLLVPSTIWAQQEYEKDTLLMVLTDQLYDPADYIRDYKEFLQFRNSL
jgi:hypothetical protein